MSEQKKGFLTDYIAERANLLDLILVTVFIAFGINLTANSFFGTTVSHRSLSIGLGICFLAILYLFIRILVKRTRIKVFEGFLVYDKNKNRIMDVPRYELADDLVHYLDSAFLENQALKVIWDKEPLKKNLESDDKPQSNQLICEAVEYFVLDNLCIHLTDYFAKEKFKSEKLDTMTREQIPNQILNNRFLELFSRPMQNRPAFVEEALSKSGDVEAIVSISGKGKEYYNKFELTLTPGSKLIRLRDNSFEVQTKKLNLTFDIQFEVFNSLLPHGFGEYYLGINPFSENFQVYEIKVNVKILFKLGILFSAKGKEYYQWIDSFLDELDTKISEITFFKSIGWDSAITVIECLKESKRWSELSKDSKK